MQELSEVCGSFAEEITGPGALAERIRVRSKRTAAYTSLTECRFRQPNFHLTLDDRSGRLSSRLGSQGIQR